MTALAAGAGVAGARILGLRNLDASESLSSAMDAMDMSMATGMADPMDEYDAMFSVADDSFFGTQDFGTQDLDPSNVPQVRPATLPPSSVRSAVALQPPISGIAAPKLAGDVDWISPLATPPPTARATATVSADHAAGRRARDGAAKDHDHARLLSPLWSCTSPVAMGHDCFEPLIG